MSTPTRQARFLALLEEHKKILHKVAGSYGRNPADRQDLVQEMVVQLWRSFERYDPSQRFSTWMYRVALNVAISFLRNETRRLRHTVPAEESILEIPANQPESDRQPLLRQFIERLDEVDKALVLLYLDGNSHQTIAEVLGISATNVGTKIGRIKLRLRRDLAPNA